MLRDLFENYPNRAAIKQKDMGAGHIVTLNGNKFLVIKALMVEAHYHLPALSDQLSLPQLKRHFKAKDGFSIQFCGTDLTLTFSCQEMIDFSDEVYFFGAPINGVRNYSRMFKSVFTKKYAQ